jgi:hypothetical protein
MVKNVGVDYWMGGIDFRGAPEEIQETTTKCPLCNEVFVNRHQKEEPVNRPGMKHVEHPTIHCMMNCKHEGAVELRKKYFGENKNSPALLFTDPGEIIGFYIEWKELAREKTTLQRRRENENRNNNNNNQNQNNQVQVQNNKIQIQTTTNNKQAAKTRRAKAKATTVETKATKKKETNKQAKQTKATKKKETNKQAKQTKATKKKETNKQAKKK